MAMSFGKYYPSESLTEDVEQEAAEITEVNRRGSTWSNVLNSSTSRLLRLGFLLQLMVLIIGLVYYNTSISLGIFSFDLFSTPEPLRNNSSFIGTMIVLESLFLLGSMFLAGFQIFTSDNAK